MSATRPHGSIKVNSSNNKGSNLSLVLRAPPLSIVIEESPPTVRTPSKGLYASESTILCSHSTWWGKVGQLHCITPRKFHRAPMMMGIIFPSRVHSAHPFCAISSYMYLFWLSNSVAAVAIVVCIYFLEICVGKSESSDRYRLYCST